MLLPVGIIFCLFCVKSRKGSYVFLKQKSSNQSELIKIQIDWRKIKWTNVQREENY